jgi:hypothetical protein
MPNPLPIGLTVLEISLPPTVAEVDDTLSMLHVLDKLALIFLPVVLSDYDVSVWHSSLDVH